MGNYIFWARGPIMIVQGDFEAALGAVKGMCARWETNRIDLARVLAAPTLVVALEELLWRPTLDSENNLCGVELIFDVKDDFESVFMELFEAMEPWMLPGSYLELANEGFGSGYVACWKYGVDSPDLRLIAGAQFMLRRAQAALVAHGDAAHLPAQLDKECARLWAACLEARAKAKWAPEI
jgi:hypothetical protein